MTDEQIVKALRCWTGKTVKDAECAKCSFGEDCSLGEIVDAAETRINELKSENAALRERLEKAVEFPFHPDDYHMEIGISKIIESPCDQSCRISIPIYVYVKCDSLEAAVSLFAELKGGEK